MKRHLGLLALAFFAMGLFSCTSDDDGTVTPTPTTTTFTATLNGSNEVPSNSSTASGSATLTFNNTTKIFTLTTTFTGLTPNAAHIHKGAIGVSGPAVFPLSDLTSPITYTSVTLDASQEADLKANLYYINLHTDAYADGEIRGQLLKQGTSGGGGGGGGGY
nr:CHRD domain-containing protein [uncultured Flavobacterium sp.]